MINSIYPYKKIEITKENIDRYKNKYSRLKHIEIEDNLKGIILLNNEDIVGLVQCNIETGYVVILEVSPKYRNKGIGGYLLDYSKNNLDTCKIFIHKRNIPAILLCQKKGYKVFKEDDSVLCMSLNDEPIDESAFIYTKNYTINESTKYERKYKCPYCDIRASRINLVHHIEEDHYDMIPKDHTPARIVFNIINKKSDGKCMICKGKTKWNESSWRYDRICSDRCRKIYKRDIIDKRMINKYGKVHLLNDPEHQKKMLSGRKISGNYKFSDGGIRSYTGSYEKNLLEFMDKVLKIPSKDIETPGPIYYYEFKGKKLAFITDLLYIPFNLIFDVKDGGDNKNTHPNLKEYREKQVAKEKAIKSVNIHNYIRLTNNNFEQLLQVMADIKMSMIDVDNKEKIIHINEEIAGAIHSEPIGPVVYLLPYSKNNIGIEGIGMIKDMMASNVFVHDDEIGKLRIKPKEDFKDYYYSIIEVKCDYNKYKKILEDIKQDDEIWDINYFTNILLDNNFNNITDILLSENTRLIHSGYDLTNFNIDHILKDISNNREENIISEYSEMLDEIMPVYECTIYDDIKTKTINNILNNYRNLVIKENHNGYFVKNTYNGKQSDYYNNIEDIPEIVLNLISL